MPADAGIQAPGNNQDFKDLDSCSRFKTCRDKLLGNDAIFDGYGPVFGAGERVRGAAAEFRREGEIKAPKG
jgi:hypothetical protein